ncbi:hypothetical protein IMZ48_44695 [Candidatus Bathyarchaeota archaeon]|nr:hypothetical protein [Candidatus Bathyarchaeota archaeon]
MEDAGDTLLLGLLSSKDSPPNEGPHGGLEQLLDWGAAATALDSDGRTMLHIIV